MFKLEFASKEKKPDEEETEETDKSEFVTKYSGLTGNPYKAVFCKPLTIKFDNLSNKIPLTAN